MKDASAPQQELPKLPNTAWAVLGLLSFPGERSGYDLKKWADSSLRFFYWSPALSQIYTELKRLEQLGFAVSRIASQDELRNKRLYSITDAGQRALAAWARETPAGPPVLKHGVALRVWMGHLSEPDELRKTLEEHRDWADRTLAEVQASEDTAHDRWPFPALVLRWSERYYQSERDLAEGMLADLDELFAKGDVHVAERPGGRG
ncbi:PadR family transcriptional regulator [Yinghuangia seranimata]|uniref:PadR family transcriptional regulator n=1 Tax=Yinghuangia seranimata TaxID=408067 RepID=UPI00248BF6A9|nr:PadR family transcriptional regulator [Yinghuangia seranimata]MDI2127421.1 PadR family transcriptional regulator [Yinghuangia seranimata]